MSNLCCLLLFCWTMAQRGEAYIIISFSSCYLLTFTIITDILVLHTGHTYCNCPLCLLVAHCLFVCFFFCLLGVLWIENCLWHLIVFRTLPVSLYFNKHPFMYWKMRSGMCSGHICSFVCFQLLSNPDVLRVQTVSKKTCEIGHV